MPLGEKKITVQVVTCDACGCEAPPKATRAAAAEEARWHGFERGIDGQWWCPPCVKKGNVPVLGRFNERRI